MLILPSRCCPFPPPLSTIFQVKGIPRAENIDVFVARGRSALSYGTLRFGSDAVLGLPRTVLARDPASGSVLDSLSLGGVLVDKESPLGLKLRNLIVPSDAVRRPPRLVVLPTRKQKPAFRYLSLVIATCQLPRAGCHLPAHAHFLQLTWCTAAQHLDFTVAHELAHLANDDTLAMTLLRPASILGGYHVTRRLVMGSSSRLAAVCYTRTRMRAGVSVCFYVLASCQGLSVRRSTMTAADTSLTRLMSPPQRCRPAGFSWRR